MSALAILAELHRRGVSVNVDGDELVLKPRRAVDAELLSRVWQHKPEIIRIVGSRLATCSPTCYEVEPGKWIHHPWDGCTTPMPAEWKPYVPFEPDCGCKGVVCPRCFLRLDHCHCVRGKHTPPRAVKEL